MPSRPLRPSQHYQFDWHHNPPAHLPTPSGLRAARATAKKLSGPMLGSNSIHEGQHKIPHVQQMQARALAAQAAHQLRAGHSIYYSCELRTTVEDRLLPQGNYFKEDVDFPTFPSLNKPLEDLIDEIQVDLSLSLVEEEYRPYTSPNAHVDISAWLPAPGPPTLVASEANIALSAVPLTEWAAEFCWYLGTRSIIPGTDFVEVLPPLQLGRAHQLDSSFASFKLDVEQALSATLTSPQGLFLGLHYIARLPIGHLEQPPLAARSVGVSLPLSLEEVGFRTILYGDNPQSPTPIDVVARSIFTLALMLSNKWLEDNTFTVRTWHDVTGLPTSQLKALEVASLRVFKFSLSVSSYDWHRWLETLRRYTAHIVTKEPIGDRRSVNALTLSRLDTVIQQSPRPEPSTSPTFTVDETASLAMPPPEQVPVGLAPLPSLPTPCKWGDLQLDTPLTAPSHARYEPVQRTSNGGAFPEFNIYSDVAVQAVYPYDHRPYTYPHCIPTDIAIHTPAGIATDMFMAPATFDQYSLSHVSNHPSVFPGNAEPDLRLWPHPSRLLLPSYT